MPTQVETVVLNGFWSEFQVDVLPKNGDVYFAFLGRVIRKPLCGDGRRELLHCHRQSNF